MPLTSRSSCTARRRMRVAMRPTRAVPSASALEHRTRDFTQRRARGYKYLGDYDRFINRARSSIRARAEHSIGVVKRVFGFVKVRYRRIAKNANRLFVTCALANLFMARRHLFRAQGRSASCLGKTAQNKANRVRKTARFDENPQSCRSVRIRERQNRQLFRPSLIGRQAITRIRNDVQRFIESISSRDL